MQQWLDSWAGMRQGAAKRVPYCRQLETVVVAAASRQVMTLVMCWTKTNTMSTPLTSAFGTKVT
jgi:hypothetical protein